MNSNSVDFFFTTPRSGNIFMSAREQIFSVMLQVYIFTMNKISQGKGCTVNRSYFTCKAAAVAQWFARQAEGSVFESKPLQTYR